MKDSKSILLLVVSVLLLLVSFALLWTWGYQFSAFTKEKSGTVYIIKDSTAAANATRDSLRRVYTSTIENFNRLDSTWTRADSLKNDLDVRLTEFYRLRNEISELLKSPVNKEDLQTARQKIDELQQKVEALRLRNGEVEKENKRLAALIEQMRRGGRAEQAASSGGTSTTIALPVENRVVVSGLFSSSDLRISAWMVNEGRETETNEALQADKITGAFVVRNNAVSVNSAELYVVVLQPNGKVLQNSAWDAGSFQTTEGRKIYSCKLRFDYNKGEAKKLSFSLSGENFQKGNYSMMIYQNGNLIGKTVRSLG